jgi:hypothetical protein
MKNLTLLMLSILAFTAGAQTPKQDTTKTKVYDFRIYRYLPAPPKSEQTNPYAFADSVKAKKTAIKKKK